MKEEDKWKTKRIELAEIEKLSNKKNRSPDQGIQKAPTMMKMQQRKLLQKPKQAKGHRG